MLRKFKDNVLSGFYKDHAKGTELLDIDLEAILDTHFNSVRSALLDNIVELNQRIKYLEDITVHGLERENANMRSLIDDYKDEITNYEERLHDC